MLPSGVVAMETWAFTHSEALYPEERLAVSAAVPKRVEEFAAGRACARAAIAAIGLVPGPLLRGANRAPIWPDTLVGSITHTDRYCAAVVAPRSRFAGIGIDAEELGRLSDAAARRVCTVGELGRLEQHMASRTDLLTLIFSAKEAFFKSQPAAGKRVTEFHDIELSISQGHFDVGACNRDGHSVPLGVKGRYAIRDGMVFAAIALEAGWCG